MEDALISARDMKRWFGETRKIGETEATAGPNGLLRLALAPEGEHRSTCLMLSFEHYFEQ